MGIPQCKMSYETLSVTREKRMKALLYIDLLNNQVYLLHSFYQVLKDDGEQIEFGRRSVS